VVAQRQLVDPLEQHRQAIRHADGRGERVQPRLERLVVQQPRAEAVERRDRELLVGGGEPVLEPLAHGVGRRRGVAQHEQRLRRGARGGEVHEPLGEDRRLAGACSAQDQQRTAGMLDGLSLGGAEVRHLRRIRRG